MRVLFVLNTFYPGYMAGAEISAYHTARQLRCAGIDCSLLVVSNRLFAKTQDTTFDYNDVPVHLVSFAGVRKPGWHDVYDHRIYRVVRDEVRRINPDLAHVHNTSGATLAPFVALHRAGVPIVCTLHDLWLLCANNMRFRSDGRLCDVSRYRERCGACLTRYDYWADVPYRRSIFAAFASFVRLFISPSAALIDQHVRAGYARARFRKVPLGLTEPSHMEPSHPGVREIVASAPLANTLVFAGGGFSIKGAGTLASAIPIMLRHIEGFRAVVAGGAGDVHFAGLTALPGVNMLGPVPSGDMSSLYGSADLTATPSIWFENSPMVIYENYQVGTPVVGSAIGGIPELIDDGETGYLFPPGDGPQLAERVIRHFARPPAERRRMREKCSHVARTRLSMERHMDGIMGVYREALAA